MPPRLASKVGRAGRRGMTSAGITRRRSGPTPGEIVAATFANVELSFTKASMAEYSKRCERMSRENELLRHQLEEHESDSIKVVQHLKEKLQCAEKEVTEQRSEIERLLAESADAEEDLRCQYERILEERDEQIVQYATIVQRLQSDLKGAAQHVHKREIHQLELKRLHDEIEEMRTRHDCELAALRFQTVDRKMRLVALEETMRERFQAQVEKESERLLEAKSKALLEDHESLQCERVRLTQDLEELVQLATVKNMECADVRRKGELHQRACEEALRRIVLGNRRARDSEAKTQRLERRVKELLREKNAMREELSRRYETQIHELEKALAETQNSLQCHRNELQRLRHIASTIVGQRSDLERFFYVALDDVRRMRSKAPRRQQVASPVQLPSLLATENNGNVAHNGANPRHSQQQQQQQAPPLILEALPSSLATKGGPTFLTESPASAKGNFNTPTASTVNTVPPSIPALSPTGPSSSVPLPSPPPGAAPGRRCGGSARPTRDAGNNNNNVLLINLGENGEGAYLNDLSWEDKEKIIKALLFFINQTCYQKLPGSQPVNSEATLMET
ncbi:hypothetical protein C3747_37g175 [Trypanosoma cruzi]|uniref:Basal body-orientation factor 1 n=2 Tax=Trypanosoma cruzi TaxID=5693 RepID=Q4DHK4_TRYCC|nr:hypothetical protein, conserved [Trypanosoma cruzi]EAN91991.1 hypothetical protein, conserved [Trypanosoma cruzi]PWV14367.1 hypothetical protein C3747_37g175 [Trypanosoma cruzi]RNC59198.1 hypothetical protein TcCL_ESM03130 [Trypanosoma cruzi]|eukprot:XP_813842.1 hypothetical protein [Trypanosoma cruzi strain CL Brener]